MALLEVEDLHVQFRGRHGVSRAVDGVSFSIEAGEVVGLVGESGSGKSVTALAILRILAKGGRIVSGQIRFDGRDLLALSEREMRRVRGNGISMIFQDPMASLNPTITVGRQIAESYYLHRGGGWRAAYPRARLNDFPHQFSGGMRQRVMIAMALACSPRLLIADEPTTALDVTVQAQILDELRQLREQTGAGIILVTHDLGVVADIADRVVVMYAGRVVEQGTLDKIFYDPQHPYTWGLLGSITRVDRDRNQRLPTIPGQPPSLLAPPEGCHFRPRCPHAFEKCTQVPDLISRLPESPDHLDRCWLEVEKKRQVREVDGQIGLAVGETVIS